MRVLCVLQCAFFFFESKPSPILQIQMFTLLVRLLAFPAAALVILYLYMRLHAFRYWQRRNIPAMAASFPFGNFAPLMRQADCIGQVITDIYNATSHRIIGIYGVQRPMLVVRDPELIQQLFVKDFAHFVDRGVYVDEVRDPLSAHLFALSGDRWRQLRNKLSPVFTSGKLKASMDTLLTCGRSLHKFMMEAAADGGAIEVREIAARFNTDVIASVAFGAEVNCMVNPETAFRKYGRQAFELSLKNGVRAFMLLVMPQLQRILGLKSVDVEVEDFIMELVRKTLEHRESGGVVRKDLFQLLLQLRNEGRVRSDDDADVWKSSGGGKSMGAVANGSPLVKSLTVEEVAAQAWIFYAAGFETSSSTMSFALFELARNLQCQRRVQEEIDRVMAKYGGQITYESLAEMRYLEMCIDGECFCYEAYRMCEVLNQQHVIITQQKPCANIQSCRF